MNRVLALVEGDTEQAFVRTVLAPELARKRLDLRARRIGKPGHKGGVRRYEVVLREIRMLLKEDPARYCTTMFDFYGLPSDWPGMAEAKAKPYREAASQIEQKLGEDVAEKMGASFNPARFIPYIQIHEFESLLFSDPAILADTIQRPDLTARFQQIVRGCGEPEAIDDDPETAPSKRILKIVPRYDKVTFGSIAATRIGLQKMRERCPHFADWLQRLDALCGA